MILVLENDNVLPEEFQKYLDSIPQMKTCICNLHNVELDDIMRGFETSDSLYICPTLIDEGQYNLMLMLMYNLIKKGELKIKEVVIFNPNEDIDRTLSAVWENKRKYLDIVIEHIKIYQVKNNLHPEKVLLNI